MTIPYRELAMQHPHLLMRECEICATGVGSDGLLYVRHADMTIPCPAQCHAGRRLLTLEELFDGLAPVLTPTKALLLVMDRLKWHPDESITEAAAQWLLELHRA